MCGIPYSVRVTSALSVFALAGEGTNAIAHAAAMATTTPLRLLTSGHSRGMDVVARRFPPNCGMALPDPLDNLETEARLHRAVREREEPPKAKVETLSKETRKASSLEGYE